MFALVLFLCYTFVAAQGITTTQSYLPNDPRNNIQHKMTCLGNTGLTEEVITILQPQQEITEDINCYFQCVLQQSGYLSPNGNIMVNQFRNQPFTNNPNFACIEQLQMINECNDMNRLYQCNI